MTLLTERVLFPLPSASVARAEDGHVRPAMQGKLADGACSPEGLDDSLVRVLVFGCGRNQY
jgi:hypothetical protein